MVDADDVGTAASEMEGLRGKRNNTQFRYGSGKVATVDRHLADLSRRTLADDDDDYDDRHEGLVADFASCYGFADPVWVLPEYIAKRDELLASWKETVLPLLGNPLDRHRRNVRRGHWSHCPGTLESICCRT